MSAIEGAGTPLRELTLDRRVVEENLTGWLRKRFGDPALAITSLTSPDGAGVNNETLMVNVRSEAPALQGIPGLVVRLEATSTLFPDVDVELQHKLYAAMEAEPAVPSPRVFGFEGDAAVLGRRFYAMERILGKIPADNPPYQSSGWFAEMSPQDRGQLWADAVRTMAAVHQVPLERVAFLREHGLGGLTEHMALIRRYFDRARRGREYPLLERTWEWLQANRPDFAPEGFAWGDARCSNMIFSGTRCVGLLDWDMTSLAGAECDLGWWLLFDAGTRVGDASLPGILGPGETIRLWEQTVDREVRDLEFWLMFNLFWLGGIMIRLKDFLIDNGTPPEHVADTDVCNFTTSILHSRFGTGVEQGKGHWDFFRPAL